MPMSVAIVIPELPTRLVVRTALECAGYVCEVFDSLNALLRAVQREDTRVVVVDLDEPTLDWRLLLEWRRNWLSPDVVLMAVGPEDRAAAAAALEAGIDDCVRRPVHGAELLARVQAARRRRENGAGDAGEVVVAGCTIDRGGRLHCASGEVELTARELGIAQLLFRQVGRVVTRQRLATEVWGASAELIGHSIEQHIYQIRRKLQRLMGGLLVLRGVYGSGYRLEVAGAPAATGRRGSTARKVQP